MKRMKKIFARFVRILTAPPIFAALLCVFLYLLLPGNFASPVHFALALGFLTGLPLLAYPIAALIPALRRKGRDGQRDLAVVFSVIGYVGGFLYALLFDGAATELVLYGTYVLSGIAIGVGTLAGFKISGHACYPCQPLVPGRRLSAALHLPVQPLPGPSFRCPASDRRGAAGTGHGAVPGCLSVSGNPLK